MTGGSARRLGAAALAVVCLIVVVGQASADEVLATLSVNDASAQEGNAVTFRITLSAADAADVTVAVATSGGSGYTDRDETVTIPAGQTFVDYSIATQENDLDHANRQFTVTLSGASGATIGDATGTGTIVDDDATPTLEISGPATVAEAATAGYSVAIDGKSADTILVDWTATPNAGTSDADYGPPRSGTLTWQSADPNPKSFSIPMVNDALDESDADSFTVTLSNARAATIATARHRYYSDYRQRR